VELVPKDLYWPGCSKDFYYTLGGSQPKRVQLKHSWAEYINTHTHTHTHSHKNTVGTFFSAASLWHGYKYLIHVGMCISLTHRCTYKHVCKRYLYVHACEHASASEKLPVYVLCILQYVRAYTGVAYIRVSREIP